MRDRWLACYPGSGSKWLLTVLRASTGLSISGVIGGIFGQYEMGSTMLVKTHHQNPDRWKQVFSVLNKHESRMWSRWSEDVAFRMKDIQFMKGRAVILFRNPYDTMISFWNHDRSGTYDGGRNKDGLKDLAESLKTDMFKDFVKNEMKLWEEIYMDYLTVGSHLMAVHYEDMKQDMAAVERDIVDYLELPVDEERIACSLKIKHDKIKRKAREVEDPFDQELRDVIEGVIERVQEMLAFRKLKPLPVERYKWRQAKP